VFFIGNARTFHASRAYTIFLYEKYGEEHRKKRDIARFYRTFQTRKFDEKYERFEKYGEKYGDDLDREQHNPHAFNGLYPLHTGYSS
jgi:hypothetical protein